VDLDILIQSVFFRLSAVLCSCNFVLSHSFTGLLHHGSFTLTFEGEESASSIHLPVIGLNPGPSDSRIV
jgi:hypothetical protein